MKNSKENSEEQAATIYLDYVNNWITVESMASGYGYSTDKMLTLINRGRIINDRMANEERPTVRDIYSMSAGELASMVGDGDIAEFF